MPKFKRNYRFKTTYVIICYRTTTSNLHCLVDYNKLLNLSDTVNPLIEVPLGFSELSITLLKSSWEELVLFRVFEAYLLLISSL